MEEEFSVKFLREEGFNRFKCRKCGEYFWSIKPRETCPDRPCSKYDFLYKNYPRTPRLGLDDARSKFINYFVKNGHGYVNPYPVLARWRNDLYLTIASIIVFQPAVTDGIVDPPYNPLVIVQPSVRLEDIDNVGLTFGRHLTSFEMGGHHAFNKKDNYIYWVEETLRYAYEFFTKEIGIPREEIVFKESWWEGGGNAGPAYEVVVDGLELATLVFMKYKIVDGSRIRNPVLVVDTGYGIERIAWFTQKTPTAFHAIFGNLVNEYKDILGIEEPEEEVLKNIVYELSDVETYDINDLKKHMVELGYENYIDEMINAINLYTVLDHIKTILLMLSDGIVPSNTGEGYLARLVIRRLLRTLLRLGLEVHTIEDIVLQLVSKQMNYWKGKYVYDKFHKHRDYIMDVLSYEIRKYIDVILRGGRLVEKIIKKKKKLSIDDLVEIYDSHGIPPEIVVEKARKYGIDIDVPPNFYSLIAKRHGGSGILVKEKEHELPDEIVKWSKSFPATRKLFHENPYLYRTIARVLGVNGNYVVFDRTIFYPKAGGQDHDIGVIIGKNGEYKVRNVHKVGEIIVHELGEKPSFVENEEVVMEIDWIRRYILMKHHTATHIILGAARKVLGDHVWQAGAEKTTEKARLDITHYKTLSSNEIKKIEEEANNIINKHIELKFHYLPKFEAEKKYGLKIYQGGAVYSPILRIVEIPGWDAEACFGTHVSNTSEVGAIKIIKSEKIQDGVIRLEFIASTKVAEYLEKLLEEREKALRLLGQEHGDLVTIVSKLKEQFDKNKDLLKIYRRLLKEKFIDEALKRIRRICDLNIIVVEKIIEDEQLYKSILEDLALKKENIVVLIDTRRKLIELACNPRLSKDKGIDLRKTLDLLKQYRIRGGGKPDHVYIHALDKLIGTEEIVKVLERTICVKT